MTTSPLFDSAFCMPLTLALLHFVWQGALIAGGTVLAAWLLGRGSPQRRYRIYLTALVLMLICLPVTLGVVVRWGASREQPVAGPSPGVSSVAVVETDGAPWHPLERRSSDELARRGPRVSAAEVTATAHGISKEAWARWTAWSYIAGVVLMLARVYLAVLGGRRLRRQTTPLREPDLLAAIRAHTARLGLRLAPTVAWCDRVLVPVVIGMLRPAILLPTALATGLTPAQIQLVIAHEMAHLYRWDHIVLVLQRVVEALFFFHPAVWYVSRRLSVERELCCDELVLRAGSNASEYAESLLRVAELSRPAPTTAPLVAIAMARGGRGSRVLVQRLSRILGQPDCSPVRLVNPWPLAVGLAVCLGSALIFGLAGNLRGPALAAVNEQKEEQAAAKDAIGLVVRINATDAKTKAPVRSLTLIPAPDDKGEKHHTWQSQYVKRYQEASAEFRMERPWDATVLRIEADGYVPFLTRPIRRDEGEVTLEVALTPDPGLAGKVLTPDGAPADGATPALCTWTNEVSVQGGKPSYSGHGRTLGKLSTAAADGTFRLASEIDPWVLVVAHDSGYAEVTAAEFAKSSEVRLRPWGRVEGEFVLNGKPVAGQAIHIGAGRGDVDVNLHYTHDVATDAEGRFAADRVPPVTLYVQPMFKHGESAFSLLRFSGRTTIAAGQTTRVTLPRAGRPVIGLVSLAADRQLRLADLVIAAEMSLRPPSIGMSFGSQRNDEWAAYGEFMKSELGKAFQRGGIAVNADGTFRIEGMPETQYVLRVTAYEKPVAPDDDREPAVFSKSMRVEVPPLSDSKEPVDLGNLVLDRVAADHTPSSALPGSEELILAQAPTGSPASAESTPSDKRNATPVTGIGEVRGRVVHADSGEPAVNADVRLIKTPDGAFILPLKPQRVRSNEQGNFVFAGLQPGSYLVYAFHGSATSRTQQFKFEKVTLDNQGRQQSTVQLQLRPGVTLRVRARSEATGKMLPGAFVHFGWTDTDDDFRADPQGEIVIPALTAEQWHIEVAAPGHCRVFRDLKLAGPETVLDIALRPGGELFGLVCDQAGQPLAGAEVSAGDDSGGGMYRYDQTTTGADGTFRLRFLPLNTSLDVSASRDGYQYASTTCSVPADGSTARAVEIRLEPLPDGGAVTGRVADAAGRPVADARVQNYGNASDLVRETRTDADGRFRLERLFVKLGDRVSLIVRAERYAPREIDVTFEQRRGAAPLAITLQPGARIRGRVVNQQGQPIARCRVYFADGNRGFGHIGGRIDADEQGRFSSNSLPPGCDFTFVARGYSELTNHTLPLNQPDEVLVTLGPIGVIRGRVVSSATGQPVGEFNVRLRFPSEESLQPGDQRPSGGIPSTRVDPGADFLDREGRFQLDDLDSGVAWELLIQARGYQPLRVPRAISSPADKAEEITLRIVPVQAAELITLRGRVVDPNGAPAVGVELRLLITEPAGEGGEFLNGQWTWIAMETDSLASRCLDYRRAVTNTKGEFEFAAVPRNQRLTLAYWSAEVPASLVDHLEQWPVGELSAMKVSHGWGVTVRGTVDRRAFPDAAEVAIDGDMKQVRDHRRPLAEGQTAFEFQGVEPGKLWVTLRDRGSPGSSPGSIIVKSIARREVTAQAGQSVSVSFDGGAESAAAKPAPTKLSQTEAFLERVETPPPPRRGRLSLHSRNAQGEIIFLRLRAARLEKADFALIGQMRELETLDLSETSVADEDLRSLAGLAKLRELKLWDTRIDGSGLVHLAALEHLERLELGDTKVTDEALRHLSKFKTLRHLVLIRAPIGDAGLAHLATLRGLQSLKLGGTQVTDEGLRSLQGIEELRGVTLDDTRVSEAGLKQLGAQARFAWAASATATAEEFVRRIERGDHQAVDEMLSVGLDIPDRGQFQRKKLEAIPPSERDRARSWQRFHVEMHWTVEAEKLDTTFYADFIVDRAAIIVHQAGIREQDAELMKVLKRLEVWVVKGNLRDVTQLTGVIKQVLGVSPTNAPAIERLSDQLVSRGWQVVVGLGKFVLLGVNRDQIGELGDQIKAEKLNLVRVLASETGPRKEALVIAESVQVAKPDRGGRDTGKSVIRLAKRDGGGWLVEDIDFESEESLKEEIDRFLKDFPDAQPVPEVDPDSVR